MRVHHHGPGWSPAPARTRYDKRAHAYSSTIDITSVHYPPASSSGLIEMPSPMSPKTFSLIRLRTRSASLGSRSNS
jgi:hypothetical protein